MTARELSIPVPPEVAETIKAAAYAAARELVADYEDTFGALPEESRERARQFLTEVGLLDDPSRQTAG